MDRLVVADDFLLGVPPAALTQLQNFRQNLGNPAFVFAASKYLDVRGDRVVVSRCAEGPFKVFRGSKCEKPVEMSNNV